LPSSLKVPNIFSPNGDGVNGLFFLNTSNLTEITFEIYNRWGNRVYSLTSDTGNIEWDGSNQYGDPTAEGTYYYIVRAKGSDGEQYDQKGTITLVR
jgi:gliding motility-associated-like protein